ncbi:ArsR/SmtB family transcription factor [Anaerosporobacter faecicola]|uniref:ArsR/SmtB family transcription factor n=1 Tax=Anaerosporobacter faecicola TaxID=2718714 RepID=UPI001EE4F598|nr:metalloregulator ArsR/SmtB family transcription factor [Anaerosporobacter faecicola]
MGARTDMKEYALICKALSDNNRLQIMEMLSEGEKCGCRILEKFNITQPTLSHHMRILCESSLVEIRKDGKRCYYSLNKQTLEEFDQFISRLCTDK